MYSKTWLNGLWYFMQLLALQITNKVKHTIHYLSHAEQTTERETKLK